MMLPSRARSDAFHPVGRLGASVKLLGGRGYRQNARHFAAAGRLDQNQIHQESGRLCGLSGRSDRKHGRDVQLRGAIPFTRDFLDRVAEGLNDLGLSG
jgi:hypothetical protein